MTSLVILALVWTQRALLSKPHPPQLEVSYRVQVNIKVSLWDVQEPATLKILWPWHLDGGSRRASAIKTKVALGSREQSGQWQDRRIMHPTWPTSCSNSDTYGRTSCFLKKETLYRFFHQGLCWFTPYRHRVCYLEYSACEHTSCNIVIVLCFFFFFLPAAHVLDLHFIPRIILFICLI